MFLSSKEAKQYFELWFPLIHYVNHKYKYVKDFPEPILGMNIDKDKFIIIRDKLWQNPVFIDEFISESKHPLNDIKKQVLVSWRDNHIIGKFLFYKQLKKHSILMRFEKGFEAKLYGVLGQTEPLSNVAKDNILPCVVTTILLPFNNKIVYDSLIRSSNISFGKQIRESIRNEYNRIKSNEGVITCL